VRYQSQQILMKLKPGITIEMFLKTQQFYYSFSQTNPTSLNLLFLDRHSERIEAVSGLSWFK